MQDLAWAQQAERAAADLDARLAALGPALGAAAAGGAAEFAGARAPEVARALGGALAAARRMLGGGGPGA